MAIVTLAPGVETLAGATLADGDTLVIADGSQTISAGGDKSTVSLAGVRLGPRFLGRNTSADPLKTDVDSTSASSIVDERPGGMPWYTHLAGPSLLGKFLRLLNGARHHLVSGGRLEEAQVRNGILRAEASVRVDALRACGGSSSFAAHSNAMTDAHLVRHSIESQRGFSGTWIVGPGASATFRRADNSTGTMPTGGTLIVCGGRVEWSLGNITELVLLDGEFDISGAPENLTIGTIKIMSHMKRSPKVKLQSATATVTLPSTVGTNLFVWGDERTDLTL